MSRARRTAFPFLAAALLPLLPALPGAAAEEDTPAAPATVTVLRRPFAVTLSVAGTLVPDGAVEVACRPEAYGGALEVVEAASAGPVVAGQMLVRFDEEPYLQELGNRERELDLSRARLQRQEDELRQKKEAAALNRQAVEIRLARAQESLTRFREVDRPLRVEQSEFSLLGTEDRIQDEKEELAQLEKMYRADDLTEETEEIVIRRARRGLARLERSFGFQRLRHRQLVDIDLPREEQDLVIELERKRQEHAAFVATQDIDLRRAELEYEKARSDHARLEEAVRDFRRDGESLRLRAPADGFAVPGEFSGAAWKDVEAAAKALLAGSRVKPEQVLFTLVKPGDVDVRTSVAEADSLRVRAGQKATVVPAVDPARRLVAEVRHVLPVVVGGKVAVRVDLSETFPDLMPGQGAEVRIVLREVPDALVVPVDAVERAEGKTRVHVWKDGKAEPREVRVGERSEGRCEVLEGLAEGETILARPGGEAK